LSAVRTPAPRNTPDTGSIARLDLAAHGRGRVDRGLAETIERSGWLEVIAVSRDVNAVISLGAAFVSARSRTRASRRSSGAAGRASSLGPAVTILVAVAFLGERLRPIQWFGQVALGDGMIAIALP
jgi:hypothetical protein